ncbi:MAG: bifunctional phosphopantothenoylcysteine decarboxylase/phosphopantothenate--cysteine ligase CoaBC [Bacteroidales bacterium]
MLLRMLNGKKIIVGLTGGIAAYKTATLVRLLIKQGAEVKVLMTDAAKQFISPLTMATLSKNPVLVEFFNPENGAWNSHVKLGLWADLFVIAPASANTMAKMANGIADNLLLTTYLSAKCPVIIAPAMDLDMYAHTATQANLQRLIAQGVKIIAPASGELASGLQGQGRMAEPEKIAEHLSFFFLKKQELIGKHFLVTAGGTQENIDAVRFIGNRSSGKMGYAIAQELAERGAKVSLISGKSSLTLQHPNIFIENVVSAAEMCAAAERVFPNVDAAFMVAAVADFTPANVHEGKLKHKGENLSLELIPTSDIAARLGAQKKKHQLLIGFALETSDGRDKALEKMQKKNLDFIVLNNLCEQGAGFDCDTNKVYILEKNGMETSYELKSKQEVAVDIVDKMIAHY